MFDDVTWIPAWMPASDPLLAFLRVMFGEEVPEEQILSQICISSNF